MREPLACCPLARTCEATHSRTSRLSVAGSLRDGEKAAVQKKRALVTAGLRDDDYLPPELLSQLPAASSATAQQQAQPEKRRPTKAEQRAAARRAQPREPQQRDGLPRTVQKSSTVEVAVLPSEGTVGQPRLHAPVKTDVRDFMQQQLYGRGIRRAPAATLASLRPAGGKCAPASNFATVPVDPLAQIGGKKRKRKATKTVDATGSHSTLERMAERIMRRNKGPR